MARLAVEFDEYCGPRDQWIDRPRVIDTATGRVLVDLTNTLWDAIVHRNEGAAVVLSMRHWPAGSKTCVLEIDAGALTFELRHVVPPWSCGDVEAACARSGLSQVGERASPLRPDRIEGDGRLLVHVSPDGRFLVETGLDEGPRMSHVIARSRVTDRSRDVTLFDGWSVALFEWEGQVVEFGPSTVTLAMRRYPGRVTCTLVLDADAGTYAIRDLRPDGRQLRDLRDRLRLHALREVT